MQPLSSFFKVRYGNNAYEDTKVLDEGNTLLIASQGIDNGAHGFYDVPVRHKIPFVTVPRTGSIGFAFVQLNECEVNNNCLVLLPTKKMTTEFLFYVAAIVRFSRWRFSYGRVITPKRLGKIMVKTPEEFSTKTSYHALNEKYYPKKNKTKPMNGETITTKEFQITELFQLERGHFHAIDRLEEGIYPTVSRVDSDNGIVGFYQKPKRAKIYPKGIITVSTVTGDAFLQYTPFIATDNVVMCIPKKPLQVSTLVYIQALLNRVKWRYSYGRQCYKGNFEKTVINLPVNREGDIDKDYIESIVTKQPYWNEFRNRFQI
jgi:hypothetical protein